MARRRRGKLQEMGVSKVGERLRIGQALARVITAKKDVTAAAVSPLCRPHHLLAGFRASTSTSLHAPTDAPQWNPR